MKIYTKTGDKGLTSLIGGSRVSKSDIRIDAYGNVDELNANIGMLCDMGINAEAREKLIRIQHELFQIGSLLACEVDPATFNLKQLESKSISRLEKEIDEMNDVLEPLRNFILPGGHVVISQCHVCRCVSRRAERSVILLNQSYSINETIIKYLNRLSDYLFIMARWLSKDLAVKEVLWRSEDT